MSLRKGQGGMTVLGMLMLAAVIGFVGLIVMKLVPMYLESFKVDQALESMSKDSGLVSSTKQDIRAKFIRRMDIEDVDRFTERNIRDYMTIEKTGNSVSIVIEYQGRTELFGNLSLVADFYKQATVR